MNKSFLAVAFVLACGTTGATFAYPSFSDSLTPNIAFGVQFGGGSQAGPSPLHFTALFDIRSQLLRPDLGTLPALGRPNQSADLAALSAGVPLLTVFQVGVNREGFDVAHVLGHNMLENGERLNETGESSSGHSWLWWAAGAVVAGTAAALSGGGHHSDSPNNSGGGCTNIVGGSGSSGSSVVDSSNPSQSQPMCATGK